MKISKTIVLDFAPELVSKITDSIMENFPECSSSLRCVTWRYSDRRFHFEDDDEGSLIKVTGEMLDNTFPLLYTNKWPKGCRPPPFSADWDDWDDWLCQCDATDFDAFIQLVCFGEVIYG
jgi:hypothetical protein